MRELRNNWIPRKQLPWKKKNATHRPLSPRPPSSIRTRLQVVHVASLFPDEHQPLQENESGRAEDAKRCSLTSFFWLPATRSLLLFVLHFRASLFRDRSTGQDVELRVWSVIFRFCLGLLVSIVGRTFGGTSQTEIPSIIVWVIIGRFSICVATSHATLGE